MKANRGQIERALEAAADPVRLFLLHGPDDAGSRDLAARLVKTLGPDAERVDLTAAGLKADPARLADEAAALSLFGGRRHIRIEPAGDEILAAVEALITAPAAGNPVVAIAGVLRNSKLLKLAVAHPAMMAFASYPPEGSEADRLVTAMARELGLQVRPDVARRIVIAMAGDRALIARELEKLALFVDAAPDRPRAIDHDALDALGADVGDGDLNRLVDAVLDGKPAEAENELARLSGTGAEAIPIIRAMLRRLHQLAELRSAVAGGNGVEAVMEGAGKSLFWRDKPIIAGQVSRWHPDAISTAMERLMEASRTVMRPGGIGQATLGEELLAVARAAQRMR